MMDPRTSAQDLMRCDLCKTAMVQMHCDTCLVKLCKACVGEHISTDECEDHKVVKFQSRKSTPLYPGCTSHDKERCEMYCRQCLIPACMTCVASNKHLGHELSKILQVLEEQKEKIANEKNEFNETIYPAYKDIVSDVQNRMSQLQKKCGNLSTAITKHGEDWHREIDKIVQKLKAEVEEMKTTQLHTLQKHLDEVNKKISDINDEINSMDVALDSNDMSKVLSVMPHLDQYKKLPQKVLPSLPQFTPGRIQELSKLFGTLSSMSVRSEEHGYSIKTTQKSPKAASSPVIKQLLDEPQAVTTIHPGYNQIDRQPTQRDSGDRGAWDRQLREDRWNRDFSRDGRGWGRGYRDDRFGEEQKRGNTWRDRQSEDRRGGWRERHMRDQNKDSWGCREDRSRDDCREDSDRRGNAPSSGDRRRWNDKHKADSNVKRSEGDGDEYWVEVSD